MTPNTSRSVRFSRDDLVLLDRLKTQLGWSLTDSVRLGLAALSALLVESDARIQMDDGRQIVRLRLGDGRSVTLIETKDGPGTFHVGMEGPGPAVWTSEQA